MTVIESEKQSVINQIMPQLHKRLMRETGEAKLQYQA